jgi:hypothetical protein
VVFSRQRPGGYGTGRGEDGETGGARLHPWAPVEPRAKAVDDGRGGRDVLHVGLRHAPYRVRRRPKARTPWESVPSPPARC